MTLEIGSLRTEEPTFILINKTKSKGCLAWQDSPEGQGAVSVLLPVVLYLLGGQDDDIIILLQIL